MRTCFRPLDHRRQQRVGQPEHAIGAQPPTQFKRTVRGIGQGAGADLRAEIVERAGNRADIGFDARHKFLNRAIVRRVEQGAAGAAARCFDCADQPR